MIGPLVPRLDARAARKVDVHMHTCAHTCKRARIDARIIFTLMYMHTHPCKHTLTDTRMLTHTRTRTRTHAHTHAHTREHAHTNTHTRTLTHMHTRTHEKAGGTAYAATCGCPCKIPDADGHGRAWAACTEVCTCYSMGIWHCVVWHDEHAAMQTSVEWYALEEHAHSMRM